MESSLIKWALETPFSSGGPHEPWQPRSRHLAPSAMGFGGQQFERSSGLGGAVGSFEPHSVPAR